MKKQKVIWILKITPILVICSLMYLNMSATTIKESKTLTLLAIRANSQDNQSEQDCFDTMLYDQERTWDRARDNMWDCVSSDFYGAVGGYFLPDTGNPVIDIANAIDDIAQTFPTIWEAYGCLDFMESQMNVELDQVISNYTDCVLF